MYYNYLGPISVPTVCQYAHDLASFLYGGEVNIPGSCKTPHEDLSYFLYFLEDPFVPSTDSLPLQKVITRI